MLFANSAIFVSGTCRVKKLSPIYTFSVLADFPKQFASTIGLKLSNRQKSSLNNSVPYDKRLQLLEEVDA